jgi:intracellular multiplication protein IcmM
MSREAWNTIKNSKQFYIATYRRAISALFFSMALNIVLGALFYFIYFFQSDPDYYSTNGITAPVKLTSLDRANFTSSPLLASDPESEPDNKVIPP